MQTPTVLRYVNVSHGAWVPHVPARDLTQADIDACPYDAATLVATGLYEPAQPRETKAQRGAGENKEQ